MDYQANSHITNKRAEAQMGERSHTLTLNGRTRLEVTGVKDVLRFDDASAELMTELGTLFVDGDGLRIETFDTVKGIVMLCGSIRTMEYYESGDSAGKPEKRRGFFGKR